MPDIIMTCLENGNVGGTFEFPTLPEEIKINGEPCVQNYKILNIGTVKIPKGNEVDEISWDGYFFNQSTVTEAIYKNEVPPVSCVEVLEWSRKNRTKWRIMITDYGIDMDVFVAKFDWSPYHGYGNIKYTIELDRWVDLQVRLLSGSTKASKAEKTKKRSSKKKGQSCSIKSGDTLSAIARKMTGKSSDWKKIYDLNKDAIEAAAKKHGRSSSDGGHWIYPGIKLTMPS